MASRIGESGRILSAWCLAVVGLTFPVTAQFAGPEFQVNTSTTGGQSASAVASVGGEGFVVVWQSVPDFFATFDLFGQRLGADGVPIGAEFAVNSDTAHSAGLPTVAGDAQGRFTVVWGSDDSTGGGVDVFARRFHFAGSPPEAVFRVNSYTTETQSAAVVASDAAGNLVVAWMSQGQDGSNYGIFGQRFDAAGAPAGGEFQAHTYFTTDQRRPAVAADAAGNFVVVWESNGQEGQMVGVVGQRFDESGAAVGGEFQVHTETLVGRSAAAVAMAESGEFVIVYETEEAPSDIGIFGQRYDAQGVPQGGEFHVNTVTDGQQGDPATAIDSAGNFVVTWTSESVEGFQSDVFGRRFLASGEPIGRDFQINGYTTGDQSASAIAVDPVGSFVVTWTSTGQDGEGYGVFGRVLAGLIFADGFSAGDVCRWSLEVGAQACK